MADLSGRDCMVAIDLHNASLSATKEEVRLLRERLADMQANWARQAAMTDEVWTKLRALADHRIDHWLDCEYDPANGKSCTCGLDNILAYARLGK